MAGRMTLDYIPGSWIMKLYGSDNKLIDIYEVDDEKFNITVNAIGKIKDEEEKTISSLLRRKA